MKKICSLLIFLVALLLTGCSNNEIPSSDIKIENAPNGVIQSCYECQSEYSKDGYIVTADKQSISLCKNCRDTLMHSNGFLLVNDKEWHLFNEDLIYRDDLVSFNIPETYEQTEVDTDLEIYEAEFVHRENSNITILFNSENFFEDLGFTPTLEDRQSMSFSSSDDIANSDLVDLLAPDGYTGYNVESIQGQAFLIYYTDLDFIKVSTLKDGVFYTFVYCDFSEDTNYSSSDLTEIMLSDLHPMFESLAYPSIDKIIDYYDNTGEDDSIENEPDSKPYHVSTKNDPLNMREYPRQEETIVGQIPKGADIQVDSEHGNWGHTYWNGVGGWVNLDYCTPGNNPDPTIISLETIVYFTGNGKRFHTAVCPHIESSETISTTLDSAYSSHGKTPCKTCLPNLDLSELY